MCTIKNIENYICTVVQVSEIIATHSHTGLMKIMKLYLQVVQPSVNIFKLKVIPIYTLLCALGYTECNDECNDVSCTDILYSATLT